MSHNVLDLKLTYNIVHQLYLNQKKKKKTSNITLAKLKKNCICEFKNIVGTIAIQMNKTQPLTSKACILVGIK